MVRCFRKNAKMPTRLPCHPLTNRKAKLKQAIFIALSRLNMQPSQQKLELGRGREREKKISRPSLPWCVLCDGYLPPPLLLLSVLQRSFLGRFSLNLELVRYAVRSAAAGVIKIWTNRGGDFGRSSESTNYFRSRILTTSFDISSYFTAISSQPLSGTGPSSLQVQVFSETAAYWPSNAHRALCSRKRFFPLFNDPNLSAPSKMAFYGVH